MDAVDVVLIALAVVDTSDVHLVYDVECNVDVHDQVWDYNSQSSHIQHYYGDDNDEDEYKCEDECEKTIDQNELMNYYLHRYY